jgi:hypothetical protein
VNTATKIHLTRMGSDWWHSGYQGVIQYHRCGTPLLAKSRKNRKTGLDWFYWDLAHPAGKNTYYCPGCGEYASQHEMSWDQELTNPVWLNDKAKWFYCDCDQTIAGIIRGDWRRPVGWQWYMVWLSGSPEAHGKEIDACPSCGRSLSAYTFLIEDPSCRRQVCNPNSRPCWQPQPPARKWTKPEPAMVEKRKREIALLFEQEDEEGKADIIYLACRALARNLLKGGKVEANDRRLLILLETIPELPAQYRCELANDVRTILSGVLPGSANSGSPGSAAVTPQRAALLRQIGDVFDALSPAKQQGALRLILMRSLTVKAGVPEPVAAERPALHVVKGA